MMLLYKVEVTVEDYISHNAPRMLYSVFRYLFLASAVAALHSSIALPFFFSIRALESFLLSLSHNFFSLSFSLLLLFLHHNPSYFSPLMVVSFLPLIPFISFLLYTFLFLHLHRSPVLSVYLSSFLVFFFLPVFLCFLPVSIFPSSFSHHLVSLIHFLFLIWVSLFLFFSPSISTPFFSKTSTRCLSWPYSSLLCSLLICSYPVLILFPNSFLFSSLNLYLCLHFSFSFSFSLMLPMGRTASFPWDVLCSPDCLWQQLF